VGPSTRPQYRTALRRFFAPFVARGVLSSNPAGPRSARGETTIRSACSTLSELKGFVHELALEPVYEDTEEFDAALILLACARLGTRRVMPLSRFTGVHPRQVAEFAERLRANGVWTADGKTACEWDHEEYGRLAFWTDVWVAEGLLERRSG